MIRKFLVATLLLCSFPVLAEAASWFLNTQAKNVGGTISSRNKVNQTSQDGSLFKSYTTHAPLGVVVAANSGYAISSVTVNGNVTTAPSSPFAASVQGMTSQSVTATFTPVVLSVTASSSAGGSVTPASVGNILSGSKLISPLVFSFKPDTGYRLVALTGASGASVSSSLPAAGNLTVKVTYPAGYTFSAPVALYGSFSSEFPVASAGLPQTVLQGSLVTLNASYTGGSGAPPASYSWTQVSGPAVTLTSSGSQASFTALQAGSYLFKVTLDTGSSATTSVQVTGSLAVAARNQCQFCHTGNGVGNAQLFGNWSASRHKISGLICYNCHIGTNTGQHPGSLTSVTVNSATFNYTNGGGNYCAGCHGSTIPDKFAASRHAVSGVTCSSCHVGGVHKPDTTLAACDRCHRDASGQVIGHPLPIGDYACTTCHDPHRLAFSGGSGGGSFTPAHFNNLTGAGYPASYVTSRISCADCHLASTENATHRVQWAASAHAATEDPPWRQLDFKTISGCVQCHTSTGFIAYSTGRVSAAWGAAPDKTKEVLACSACHSDVSTGQVRRLVPLQPFADEDYLSRDVGVSNVCMRCHSGRNNGSSIQVRVGSADFGNLAFIAPHYLAAGATLHSKGGYHFPGRSYAGYSSNSHRTVGMSDSVGTGTSGPCVGCHRSATDSHRNRATQVEPDGTVSAISAVACANCHADSLDAPRLNTQKLAYKNALKVLRAMLADRGFSYSPQYPYFNYTNWGSGQAGANTMGAAFNYVYLLSDTGAYAHNSAYAKQLIADSIDSLYNGSVTGSLETALNHLESVQAISHAEALSLAEYRGASSCTSCHANTSGSHPAHLASGFGCEQCHAATAQSSSALLPGNATHLNRQVDLAAGPGRSFSYSYASGGGTCSGISCHNNGGAVWGSTLGCDGCHDAPPATASHLKHFGGSASQAAYGSTSKAADLNANAGSYLMNCGNCHPIDRSKHGNGIVEVELYDAQAPAGSLKALNPPAALYAPGSSQLTDSRGLPFTLGTCSNIYCHSYTTWTTSAPVPDGDPNWQSKVVTTRVYRSVTWGGAPLGCAGCHGNPSQTSYPANDGGAGDSHSWIDGEGYQNLHTYNMGSTAPVSCKFCHNATVQQLNSYTADSKGNWTLSNVPIGNFSKHVNGVNDVAFDRQNPFSYSTWYNAGPVPMSLSNAGYDPATKTCANVSCHIKETSVKWGTPYRYYYNECDRCHQYGGS